MSCGESDAASEGGRSKCGSEEREHKLMSTSMNSTFSNDS